MALALSVSREGGVATVTVGGDLDLATAGELESCLAGLAGGEVTSVMVDLHGVEFVDSAGINVLLHGRRHAMARAQTFVISRASGAVREVLELTGVWAYLSTADA
jgi:anti-anti-sigma factor